MTHTGGRPQERESWWMVGPVGRSKRRDDERADEHQPLPPTTGAADASVSERRGYRNACGAGQRRCACGPNEPPNFPRIQQVGLIVVAPGAGETPYIASRCTRYPQSNQTVLLKERPTIPKLPPFKDTFFRSSTGPIMLHTQTWATQAGKRATDAPTLPAYWILSAHDSSRVYEQPFRCCRIYIR